MKKNFWKDPPKEIAKSLIGATMIVGDQEAIILEAQGYPRKDNETGVYKPVTEIAPGSVYCPRMRNAVLILIATYDNGSPGGCVLIRAAEINGEIYKGPGVLSERLGVCTPKSMGSTKWIDDDNFIVHIEGVLDPVIKPGRKPRTGNGIGKKTLKKLMPSIAKKFMKVKPEGGFESFLNTLLAEAKDEKHFRKLLRERG